MTSARQLEREIAEHLDRRRKWRRGSEVQALLFARPQWTPREARSWAERHGFGSGKVHATANYLRLRQFSPARGAEKRTITFGRGIKAIVEQVK